MDSKTFDTAYWLSKAPEVRTAFDVNNAGQDLEVRTVAAQGLMKRGFIVDREIMIWVFPPYLTMLSRQMLGFTWVPNAVQPASWASVGGASYDPKNPLPGSIKVSVDIADYPPFDPPIPVTPSTGSLVGAYLGNGFYTSLAGENAKDGEEAVKDGITYVLHRYPFGGWYTKKG